MSIPGMLAAWFNMEMYRVYQPGCCSMSVETRRLVPSDRTGLSPQTICMFSYHIIRYISSAAAKEKALSIGGISLTRQLQGYSCSRPSIPGKLSCSQIHVGASNGRGSCLGYCVGSYAYGVWLKIPGSLRTTIMEAGSIEKKSLEWASMQVGTEPMLKPADVSIGSDTWQ